MQQLPTLRHAVPSAYLPRHLSHGRSHLAHGTGPGVARLARPVRSVSAAVGCPIDSLQQAGRVVEHVVGLPTGQDAMLVCEALASIGMRFRWHLEQDRAIRQGGWERNCPACGTHDGELDPRSLWPNAMRRPRAAVSTAAPSAPALEPLRASQSGLLVREAAQ